MPTRLGGPLKVVSGGAQAPSPQGLLPSWESLRLHSYLAATRGPVFILKPVTWGGGLLAECPEETPPNLPFLGRRTSQCPPSAANTRAWLTGGVVGPMFCPECPQASQVALSVLFLP